MNIPEISSLCSSPQTNIVHASNSETDPSLQDFYALLTQFQDALKEAVAAQGDTTISSDKKIVLNDAVKDLAAKLDNRLGALDRLGTPLAYKMENDFYSSGLGTVLQSMMGLSSETAIDDNIKSLYKNPTTFDSIQTDLTDFYSRNPKYTLANLRATLQTIQNAPISLKNDLQGYIDRVNIDTAALVKEGESPEKIQNLENLVNNFINGWKQYSRDGAIDNAYSAILNNFHSFSDDDIAAIKELIYLKHNGGGDRVAEICARNPNAKAVNALVDSGYFKDMTDADWTGADPATGELSPYDKLKNDYTTTGWDTSHSIAFQQEEKTFQGTFDDLNNYFNTTWPQANPKGS